MLNENTIYSLQMHGTTEGSAASCWKMSDICPVYKNKGVKSEKSNYRPIALLSCMSNILEIIIYKSLYEYCVSHELLISENSRFKRNNSTINQLLAMNHNIYQSLDTGKGMCAILLDVSKAFDQVWHKTQKVWYNWQFNFTVGTLPDSPISKSNTKWQNFTQSTYIILDSTGFNSWSFANFNLC